MSIGKKSLSQLEVLQPLRAPNITQSLAKRCWKPFNSLLPHQHHSICPPRFIVRPCGEGVRKTRSWQKANLKGFAIHHRAKTGTRKRVTSFRRPPFVNVKLAKYLKLTGRTIAWSGVGCVRVDHSGWGMRT